MSFFKNKYTLLLFLFVIFLVLAGFIPKNEKEKEIGTSMPSVTKTVTMSNNFEKIYYGAIPCDGICKSDEMTLTLKINEGRDGGTFKLLEKRVGQWSDPLEFEGDWIMSEGLDDEHPDAKIIVLNPEDEEIITGFWVVNETEIEVLDEDGYRYSNGEKYRLKLQ